MNPLFRNDAAGEYPPSWYTATAETAPERPALAGDLRLAGVHADVSREVALARKLLFTVAAFLVKLFLC